MEKSDVHLFQTLAETSLGGSFPSSCEEYYWRSEDDLNLLAKAEMVASRKITDEETVRAFIVEMSQKMTELQTKYYEMEKHIKEYKKMALNIEEKHRKEKERMEQKVTNLERIVAQLQICHDLQPVPNVD